MARWSGSKLTVWLVGACAIVACGGGQTGQPGVFVPCVARATVPANNRVQGVSPAELARVFEGRHTAPLGWLSKKSDDAGAPVREDEITVEVVYRGSDGTTCDDLQVDVTVAITTRDSAVNESGTTTLVGRAGSRDFATFALDGERVKVRGVLKRSNGAVELSGALESIAGDLPADTAVFPPPPVGVAGTGSGGSRGAP